MQQSAFTNSVYELFPTLCGFINYRSMSVFIAALSVELNVPFIICSDISGLFVYIILECNKLMMKIFSTDVFNHLNFLILPCPILKCIAE